MLQPLEHGQRRVVMRRQHLAEMHMAVGIKQRYIGKRATNIGSNSQRSSHTFISLPQPLSPLTV
jgi:hypothetical protein